MILTAVSVLRRKKYNGLGNRKQPPNRQLNSIAASLHFYPLECRASGSDVARVPRPAASILLSTPVWKGLRRRQ